jgi:hypothetical protein
MSTEVQINVFASGLDLEGQAPSFQVADRGACRKLSARGDRSDVIAALSSFVEALNNSPDGQYMIKVFVHDREVMIPTRGAEPVELRAD